MEAAFIVSFIAILISLVGTFVSILIYINSKKMLKNAQNTLIHSKNKYLYELRLSALKSVKEVESTWQKLLNDIYHEKKRIEDIKNIENFVSQYVENLYGDVESGLLQPSLKNIKKISKDLEEGFDEIKEDDAKFIIRIMETMIIGLNQAHTESKRKYQLLYSSLEKHLPD
jgi:hypothetical protein